MWLLRHRKAPRFSDAFSFYLTLSFSMALYPTHRTYTLMHMPIPALPPLDDLFACNEIPWLKSLDCCWKIFRSLTRIWGLRRGVTSLPLSVSLALLIELVRRRTAKCSSYLIPPACYSAPTFAANSDWEGNGFTSNWLRTKARAELRTFQPHPGFNTDNLFKKTEKKY